MNKPILDKSISITRGALPGSRKLMVDGVPFRVFLGIGRGRGVIRIDEAHVADFLRLVENNGAAPLPPAPSVRLKHLRLP